MSYLATKYCRTTFFSPPRAQGRTPAPASTDTCSGRHEVGQGIKVWLYFLCLSGLPKAATTALGTTYLNKERGWWVVNDPVGEGSSRVPMHVDTQIAHEHPITKLRYAFLLAPTRSYWTPTADSSIDRSSKSDNYYYGC